MCHPNVPLWLGSQVLLWMAGENDISTEHILTVHGPCTADFSVCQCPEAVLTENTHLTWSYLMSFTETLARTLTLRNLGRLDYLHFSDRIILLLAVSDCADLSVFTDEFYTP